MKKEVNVHRLPTEDRTSKIWLDNDTGKLLYDPVGVMNCTPQHLYITTDEEIKEGDWVLWFWDGGQIGVTQPQQYLGGEQVLNSGHRKIIATTDPNLYISETDEVGITTKFDLPQIQQSFIEEYCKVGGIDKVLVEYKEWECFNPKYPNVLKLKTDSNNCTIIHPVEEKMYSREDMESKIIQAIKWGYERRNLDLSCKPYDWIKGNL